MTLISFLPLFTSLSFIGKRPSMALKNPTYPLSQSPSLFFVTGASQKTKLVIYYQHGVLPHHFQGVKCLLLLFRTSQIPLVFQ